MKTIAVLITVHNRREKTLECLSNLAKQGLPSGTQLSIYLTDDGCTDGTSEAVRKEYPYVHIVDGDGSLFWNRGMVAAWNEAAKKEHDFYLWLNDDTFIYDGAIGRLLECSMRHADNAIVVGATCAVGNASEITYGGWRGGKVLPDVSEEYECETFNGNIVLIPKYVYNILGTNDPRFRHCLGDTDYGLRANEKSIEVWQAKGLMGECDKHEHPTVWMDPSQPFSKRRKNFYSPTGNNPFEFFYFRKKHYGLIPACMTFVSNYVHFLLPWLWKKSYKGYSPSNE